MSLKRIICIALIIVFVLALAACGNDKTEETTPTAESAQAVETKAQEAAATEAETQQGTAVAEVEKAVPGTLYALNLKDGEDPVVTALKLDGNRLGTAEGINGKKPAAEGIRSVFELNEWIEITPETTETALTAYVVPHADDPAKYTETYVFPDDAPTVALEKPEEDTCWGSVYVNPDDSAAGDFDLVITAGTKPVAYVMIKLYNKGELDGKPDAELEQLMK